MTGFGLDTASLALRQIMLAESATEWRPRGDAAEILIADGTWLYCDSGLFTSQKRQGGA